MYYKVEERFTHVQTHGKGIQYVFDKYDEKVHVDKITLAKTYSTNTRNRRLVLDINSIQHSYSVAVFVDVKNDMWITADDEERIC